jgi:hypothetical protein
MSGAMAGAFIAITIVSVLIILGAMYNKNKEEEQKEKEEELPKFEREDGKFYYGDKVVVKDSFYGVFTGRVTDTSPCMSNRYYIQTSSYDKTGYYFASQLTLVK